MRNVDSAPRRFLPDPPKSCTDPLPRHQPLTPLAPVAPRKWLPPWPPPTGRTYFTARFLLAEDQTIVLAASTTATDPLADPNHSDVLGINFLQVRAQEILQDRSGLASFEFTAEFTE